MNATTLRTLVLAVLPMASAAGMQRGGGSTPAPDPAIAFQSGGGLYVMNGDGTNVRLVLGNVGAGAQPSWSPDSQELGFAGTPGGQANGIWAVRIDGSGLRRVASLATGATTAVAWSPVPAPDGRAKIAYVAPVDVGPNQRLYEVFLANADGSGEQRLTTTTDHEMDVAWSPEATRLAVTAIAMVDGAKPYCAVLALGADAGQVVVTAAVNVTMIPGSPLLATNGTTWSLRSPSWARHADFLLLSAKGDTFGFDLWLLDLADPAHPVRVAATSAAEKAPCWSPDDTRITFWKTGASKSADGIYRMAADGSGLVQIQRGGSWPDWRRTP